MSRWNTSHVSSPLSVSIDFPISPPSASPAAVSPGAHADSTWDRQPSTMPGRCDTRLQPVADAFAANFSDGLEVGAACAVVLDGHVVVDIWDGAARRDGAAWTESTLVE